jgi:TonB dependent receptor
LKFGANYRQLFMNFRQHGEPSGQYSFGNVFTQQRAGAPNSTTQGMGFASFLLGYLDGGTIQHTFSSAMESKYFGFYAQDDWKVTNKLTLNIGLRWDVDLPRTERYNRLNYWDITADSPINGKVPNLPGRTLKGAMRFVDSNNRRQTPTDKNNWGPRFGFVYAINNATVFRGSYGIIYSPSVLQAAGTSGSSGTAAFQSSTGVSRSFDGDVTAFARLDNPFPNGFNRPQGIAGGAATQLGLGISDVFFIDNANPIIQEWSATLQRNLGKSFVVEAGYLANKGNHLIDGEGNMTYNQLPSSYWSLGNQLLGQNTVPNPFYGVAGINPTSSLAQPTVAYSQLLRPFPQYTSVNGFRKPQGNSIYHAFTLSVTKRYSNGLNLQASYTTGKLLDDVSQTVTFLGAAGTKQDFYCRSCERAISAQDVAQRLVISSNYELPFGKGRKFMTSAPRALDAALGGWQVNGILTLQTALPMQITQNGNNTQLGSSGQRPSNNGKSPKKTGPIEDRLNSYFDQSVFSQTGNFAWGTVSRTSPDLRGPRENNFDASLFKRFVIREALQTELRAEAFNFFNHPIWNGPGTNVSTPGTFGIIQSKGGQRRVMQVALRIIW